MQLVCANVCARVIHDLGRSTASDELFEDGHFQRIIDTRVDLAVRVSPCSPFAVQQVGFRIEHTGTLKTHQRRRARLDRIAAGVGPAQVEDLQAALRDVRALTARANTIAGDVQAVSARVRSGQGTVGALLMDEEIYDDLQELVRDLKHNPWKFFWRE